MTPMDVTRRLAEFAAGLEIEAIPAAVLERAKQCLCDFLGLALRASRDTDSAAPITTAVLQLAGEGPCTVIGHACTLPPHYAALLNGAYAHSLDFDDTHALASLHPGAPVIGAGLALARSAPAPARGSWPR